MKGYFDKWIKEEITVDGSQTERTMKRTFHAGIRFESYAYLSDEADLFTFYGNYDSYIETRDKVHSIK